MPGHPSAARHAHQVGTGPTKLQTTEAVALAETRTTGQVTTATPASWTSGQPKLPVKALWTRCPRQAQAPEVRASVAPVPKAKELAPKDPAEPKGKPKGCVRYLDGAGNTWSGFGTKPKWFVQALADGRTDADLLA